VDCVPTRSDLLDRCLLVALDRIDESLRLPESELWAKFDALAPALLGAVLDMVSTGLRNESQVTERLPRMAQFAKFGVAALGTEFLDEYRRNIANAEIVAVESNPVASAIQELITAGNFEGTATQLLVKLQNLSDCPKVAKLTSRGLGRLLNSRAFTQDLLAVGVSVDSYRKAGGNRERGWIISATPPPGDNPQSTGTFATQNRTLVQMENPNGETFFNGGQKADNGEIKTSQTSLTSQTPINTDSPGGTLFGTLSENVPKTSLLCPANNVQNVPPPEVPTGADSGKINPHEGDIRDIRDVFKTPLSGASNEMKNLSQPDSSIWTKEQKSVSHVPPANGQSPPNAEQKLADFFGGKVIQVDLSPLIGGEVTYQGRAYILLDYLPASERCQISNGGEILIVPSNQVSIPDPF